MSSSHLQERPEWGRLLLALLPCVVAFSPAFVRSPTQLPPTSISSCHPTPRHTTPHHAPSRTLILVALYRRSLSLLRLMSDIESSVHAASSKKRSTSFRGWLPALVCLGLAATAGFIGRNADVTFPEGRPAAVQEHHNLVFSPRGLGSAGGKNWFNDARVSPSEAPVSDTKRIKWGTARYPPAAGEGASGRHLYESHVDVSDQVGVRV